MRISGGFRKLEKNNTVIEQKNIAVVYDHTIHGNIAAGGTGLTSAAPTYPDTDYKTSGSVAINTISIPGVFTSGNDRFVNPPNKYILQKSAVYLQTGDEITISGSFFFAPFSGSIITNLFKGLSGAYYTGTATVKLISGTFF